MSQDLIVVVPAELRDTRGVELDQALKMEGAEIIREQRRYADAGEEGTACEMVELLVRDTNAPDHLRGRRVRPVWADVDQAGELVLDRWEALRA